MEQLEYLPVKPLINPENFEEIIRQNSLILEMNRKIIEFLSTPMCISSKNEIDSKPLEKLMWES